VGWGQKKLVHWYQNKLPRTLAALVGLSQLSAASPAALLLEPPQSLLAAFATGAYVGALSSALLAMMIVLVFQMAFWLRRARKIRLYPLESTFTALAELMILLSSEREGDFRMPEPSARTAGIAGLEEAARCFEVGLPRLVRLPGQHERAVARERLQGIAHQFRQWQLVLALPSREGLAGVADAAAVSMRTITLGWYDELPSATLEPLSTPQRIGALRELLRALVVAILPVAAFATAWRLGVPLDGLIGTLAWVSAIAWAVVCLIAAVDPSCGSKLTAAREFLDILQRNR
jgi:hypothetical protein